MRRGPNPPLKPKVLTRALVGLLLTLYSERSEASWGPQTHSLYGSGFGDAAPSFAEPRGGPNKIGCCMPLRLSPPLRGVFYLGKGLHPKTPPFRCLRGSPLIPLSQLR